MSKVMRLFLSLVLAFAMLGSGPITGPGEFSFLTSAEAKRGHRPHRPHRPHHHHHHHHHKPRAGAIAVGVAVGIAATAARRDRCNKLSRSCNRGHLEACAEYQLDCAF